MRKDTERVICAIWSHLRDRLGQKAVAGEENNNNGKHCASCLLIFIDRYRHGCRLWVRQVGREEAIKRSNYDHCEQFTYGLFRWNEEVKCFLAAEASITVLFFYPTCTVVTRSQAETTTPCRVPQVVLILLAFCC